MPELTLHLGTIDYTDTGAGPSVVLIHGLVQSATLWNDVAADLARDHRVIAPTLPFGSHRRPMRPDAELSPRAVARTIGDIADALDLPADTVFVENDTGRLQQLAAERPARVRRMMLTGCEAFDNYPPGSGGKLMDAAAKVPGGVLALAIAMTPRPVRRLRGVGYAALARNRVPDALTDAWIAPFRDDRAIRRDLVRYLRAARGTEMIEAAEALRAWDGDALVVWGRQDRLMPLDHGRRLAALLGAELIELDDCGTLVPLDRPRALAEAIRNFARSR